MVEQMVAMSPVADTVHTERIPRQGQGRQLAPYAQGTILHGYAVASEGFLHGFGLPTNDFKAVWEFDALPVPVLRYRVTLEGWFTDIDGTAPHSRQWPTRGHCPPQAWKHPRVP
jgi:hypothetical protein